MFNIVRGILRTLVSVYKLVILTTVGIGVFNWGVWLYSNRIRYPCFVCRHLRCHY